ncbi:TonB-dependent receptor [uncultured Desulfosarcina sp.]|uniref:TonB-dependent receptor n=1 Tax=uncultured Desulfosarcina sp. TaxID=218289 RepID=UPI0029C63E8E|nr:TonB-dependent receptor [uncultured Desulfosarcina sp.]
MRKTDLTTLLFLIFIFVLVRPGFADNSSSEAPDTDPAETAQTVETLDPMVVTAQKRSQNVQDLPGSITLLDAETIEDARIEGMTDISGLTPGLEFRNAGSRRHSFTFMRGIKSIHNQESAMGYYVDGVGYSKSYMFDFPLFGVERIEVLKGPQGTLYGGNTMAGVINVITAEPDNLTCSKLALGLGNYDRAEVKGSVRTPLIADKLFFGLSGLFEQQDEGFMENDVEADGDEGRHSKGGSGRFKLKFLPTDDLDVTLSIDGQSYDEGAFPLRRTARNAFVKNGIFQADPEYHYSHDFEGTADTDFWGANLNINYAFPFATLVSITGHRDYRVDEMVDSDFSPLDMTRLHYVQEDKSFTQELRLVSPESDDMLQWLAGLYYFSNDAENRTTNYFRSAMVGNPNNPFGTDTGNRLIISDGTTEGMAVFGQGTYRFLEQFDFTLGLRYEYQDAEMNWTQENSPDHDTATTLAYPTADNDFDALLPKASLAWHMTANHMVYATFSGGFRGGGFNKVSPEENRAFDEETNWMYEIGTKLSFLEKRIFVNLSGFYMDIEDEQIARFDTDLNSAYNVNAGESHRLGIEMETRYTPVSGLDFIAGFTVLEAEYDSYSDAALGTDYSGNQVFNVPNFSGNIGVQYRRPLYGQWDFMGRVDVIGIGKRYMDDANEVEEGSYALVNAKAGIEGEHLDIYLWSDNLFDRHYIVFENTSKGITEDGAPLTVGATVSYRF